MAQIVYSRWAVLATALLVESIGGLFYMFGVFSQTLKQAHWSGGASVDGTLTQSQVNQIAMFANLGGNFGVHVGLLYDKFGPTAAMGLSTLLGVSGWTGMWAALAFPSVGVPYFALLIFSFCQGHSQLSSDAAVVPTIAKLFPKQRGMALGLTKSLVGLSGAIATRFYDGFFEPDVVNFMLFIVCEVATIGMLALLIFIHSTSQESQNETFSQATVASRRFIITFRIMLLLLIELLLAALLSAVVSNGLRLGFAVLMLLIFGTLLAFVGTRKDQSSDSFAELSDRNEMLAATETRPDMLEIKNFTPCEALGNLGFWLMLSGCVIGGGSGFVVINNVAQMNLALGGNPKLKDVFVTILSVSNCAGRLGFGAVSDYFLHTCAVPRPFFLGIAVIFMCLTHASLLMISSPWIMYVAATGAGLGFGGINALSPIVASELYGNKHFGTIYMLVSLGYVLGSYLSAWLCGSVYDQHAVVNGDVKSCNGRACFALTELICMLLTGICSFTLLCLALQSRARYRQMYPTSRACR